MIVRGWRHGLVAGGVVAACAAAVVAQSPVRADLEGYVYRDIHDEPLPNQSNDWIEEVLEHGRLVSQKNIPVGVTNPRQLVLAYGDLQVHASLKDVDRTERNRRDRGPGGKIIYREWRDWWGYDIAAYRLDQLLGINRVPPTVERRVKNTRGAVSIWLEDTITERERQERKIAPPDLARFNQQKQTLRLFDNLVANRDSNLGNALIDGNWRIWFIDFSRGFGTQGDLIYPEAVTHCDRQVLRALRGLDRESATAALSDHLTRYEIAALLERRDRLVAHIEGLISERGETMVLFDSRPPTDTAPWARD